MFLFIIIIVKYKNEQIALRYVRVGTRTGLLFGQRYNIINIAVAGMLRLKKTL